MRETRDLVENGPKGVDPLLRKETQALLDWMVDEHFTFLGYREYTLSKRGKQTFLDVVEGSGLFSMWSRAVVSEFSAKRAVRQKP
jgi:glutamate dehydrogenase